MSTPTSISIGPGSTSKPTSPAPSTVDDEAMDDIPRRPMRVKILYTFDDQNKSNCLARLPNVLHIPVVALDENTQVGVIELKTCIQAIVAASPELVAKLGHDFTVYAYDFSEYETPLVGQGMLSWILASASATPNAPAEQSQTMVTGRVCKNILGLFSNGVKETLEVKLKLVPVPTCMQKEYVENMERYHSLSVLMPDGFDYSAWSDFLKENPTLGQLAQPDPIYPQPSAQRPSFGGVDSLHHMLTRQTSHDGNDSFYDQSNASLMSQPNQFQSQPTSTTRASSPANSMASFRQHSYNQDSRPGSRASIRSEAVPPPQPPQFSDPFTMEEQEEGPPKKRAKIIQAQRPKRTPLTAPADSLRVTASTAASVRLHKPVLGHSAAMADLIPRAPTPQPKKSSWQYGQRRPPAPSTLRHASVDTNRSYVSPYDTTSFSDHAMDSADERDASPGDTPMDIPSSPPIVPQRTVSPAPSSPVLPTLPIMTDSGFVSDMTLGRDDDVMDVAGKPWDGSDLPVLPDERQATRQNKSRQPWQVVNPGPMERLPQSYVPRPKQHYRKYPLPIAPKVAHSIESDTNLNQAFQQPPMQEPNLFSKIQQPGNANQVVAPLIQPTAPQYNALNRSMERPIPTDTCSFGSVQTAPSRRESQVSQIDTKAESPEAIMEHIPNAPAPEGAIQSRSATPNLPPRQQNTQPKARGLPRSHTWSGAAEPMSDAHVPESSGVVRSGSGAKRKKYIMNKLDAAIAAGEMPVHCVNCGEIDTPTWRKAHTRIETEKPEEIPPNADTAGTGIIAWEALPVGEDGEQKYRIFKNNLTQEERKAQIYDILNMCNPCGLWLMKKGEMRPAKIWNKPSKMAKRRGMHGTSVRSRQAFPGDELMSDAVVPTSEPAMPDEHDQQRTSFPPPASQSMPPPQQQRATSVQDSTANVSEGLEAAEAALRRAIQSSPAGLRGSKASPIELDPDLTPKPTRRLLFPSPRKDGEVKSLLPMLSNSDTGFIGDYRELQEKPRCQRCKHKKRGCDRQRPCGRCVDAGIDYDGCIPCEPPKSSCIEQRPIVQMAIVPEDNPDKENCPPPTEEDDGLAHLFESPQSRRITPKKNDHKAHSTPTKADAHGESNADKDDSVNELLKTPTPSSRRRSPLTAKRYAETDDFLKTPSRNVLTPRGTRAATIAPETPFTRQLNALLSSCPISSPTQNLDFSTFPTFTTPGRPGVNLADILPDDFLSSDMPLPSSPPKSSSLAIGFDLYEDPNTSTMGLWDTNMFSSDDMIAGMDDSSKEVMDLDIPVDQATLLKLNVNGVTVDFAAMIEEVVRKENAEEGEAEGDVVERSKEKEKAPVEA